MNRHLSRIVIMQSLFELDFHPEKDIDAILDRNIAEYKHKVDENFIRQNTHGLLDKVSHLEHEIELSAPDWPLDQISGVDKNTLLLAIYELLNTKNTPPKVVINEAVELAKQFGGEASSKFVNGVLGAVYKKIYDDK